MDILQCLLAKSGKTVKASEAVVLMIFGTATRWKYVIAYHLTGDSINAQFFKDFLFELIIIVENFGLNINLQMDDELKMAPRLESHNLRPSNFEKTRVPVKV